MGGKGKIAKYIIPFITEGLPANIYDMFCGGLNFSDKINTKINVYANDNNKYLIAMWQGLQQDLKRPYEISKELYSAARTEFNNKTNVQFSDFEIGWIGWAASFNGRFFDGGYSGKTEKRNYVDEQIRNIEKQIKLIQEFSFISLDYFDVEILPNSNIYCDIPYKGKKQYLTSKNFDYDKFYNWCRLKTKQGFKVFISEYEMPSDFKIIWEKEVTNSMNTTKTYKPVERLFLCCV